MNDCVFCKLVAGDIPSHKVYEDDLVLAFLDIQPLSEGHTLIISKQHADDLRDVPAPTAVRAAEVAQKLAKQYAVSLKAEGFNVLHSSGAAAQQQLPHFHIHLVPRYKDDGLDTDPKHTAKKFDINQIAQTINGQSGSSL